MARHQTAPYGAVRSERLLTINDVAELLAISRDSVYRLVQAGAFPAVRVGERMRFRPAEIDAYLERQKVVT